MEARENRGSVVAATLIVEAKALPVRVEKEQFPRSVHT